MEREFNVKISSSAVVELKLLRDRLEKQISSNIYYVRHGEGRVWKDGRDTGSGSAKESDTARETRLSLETIENILKQCQ